MSFAQNLLLMIGLRQNASVPQQRNQDVDFKLGNPLDLESRFNAKGRYLKLAKSVQSKWWMLTITTEWIGYTKRVLGQ